MKNPFKLFRYLFLTHHLEPIGNTIDGDCVIVMAFGWEPAEVNKTLADKAKGYGLPIYYQDCMKSLFSNTATNTFFCGPTNLPDSERPSSNHILDTMLDKMGKNGHTNPILITQYEHTVRCGLYLIKKTIDVIIPDELPDKYPQNEDAKKHGHLSKWLHAHRSGWRLVDTIQKWLYLRKDYISLDDLD